MPLKQEIETWVTALARYDNNEFEDALQAFESIADTSKILFNCGVIYATLGEHDKAVTSYQRAIKLDQYLAVAYFQQGVSNFLIGDFEEALANFNDALLYLRGNNNIDYDQLGLKFKLFSCEALFNRGLCYIYLQQVDAGMQDLVAASKEKVIPDHDVINEAITEQAEGYTVFSIPVGLVFRPNESKVKNLKSKDYLGKARLVAASDRFDAFTGFTGAERKRSVAETETATKDDSQADNKPTFAASSLVKPGLHSRSRQQSEPPIARNLLPPTPPPEAEASDSGPARSNNDGTPTNMSRAQSVRGSGPKPLPPEAAWNRPLEGGIERPRIGTIRSASERPQLGREFSTSLRLRDPQQPRGQSIDEGQPQRRGSRDQYQPRFAGPDDGSTANRGLYSRQQSLDDQVVEGPTENNYDFPPRRKSKAQRPMYIEEEDEEDESDYNPADFEMMARSKSRYQAPGRRVETRRIRIKVHSDDTRYVVVGVSVMLPDLMDQIRAKFAIRRNIKIKTKDEGDMITLADQDDLDLAIFSAKDEAQREGCEMGKMEIWIEQLA